MDLAMLVITLVGGYAIVKSMPSTPAPTVATPAPTVAPTYDLQRAANGPGAAVPLEEKQPNDWADVAKAGVGILGGLLNQSSGSSSYNSRSRGNMDEPWSWGRSNDSTSVWGTNDEDSWY